MYNLHIKKINRFYVKTYKWKYLDIVKSSNLSLPELEEIKNCK